MTLYPVKLFCVDRVGTWRAAAMPRHPDAHLIKQPEGGLLFVVNASQIYAVDDDTWRELSLAIEDPEPSRLTALLASYGASSPPAIDDQQPLEPPLRSISLAVAQTCNLACTYCYAKGGDFGQPPRAMPEGIARAAIDRLLASCPAGSRASIAFLGGEPLLARDVLRNVTEYAVREASMRGIRLGFSITTNGTMLHADDSDFFVKHGFAVTISVDGVDDTHDRLRPFKNGRGSWARLKERAQLITDRMPVAARVTVTPHNLDILATVDALLAFGFAQVGVSPLVAAPSGNDEILSQQWAEVLSSMVRAAQRYERMLVEQGECRFSNLTSALREIHRGTHRPYPCGAGAGYVGVAADGELYACHRFVGDKRGHLGSVEDGIHREQQSAWLAERHVDRQSPCHGCWARYLCGGGCHHEVIQRGRPACDYIRGWLHHCLGAYDRVRDLRPTWFDDKRSSR